MKHLKRAISGGMAGKPEWFKKGGILSKIDKGIVKYNFEVGAGQ